MGQLTSREIGTHCGIPERTIRDWQTKGIVPKTDDLSEVVRSVVAYYKQIAEEKLSRGSKDEDEELYWEKVRLTRAQATEKELALSQLTGETVKASETVQVWSNYILACRARLLSLPSRHAQELAGISTAYQVQQILQSSVDEALQELGSEQFVDYIERGVRVGVEELVNSSPDPPKTQQAGSV